MVRASWVLPSSSMDSRALDAFSASIVSWPGRVMWTGSVPWPYRTAGIWWARRMRRAAPLPNSVRVWATSLVSDMCLSWSVGACAGRRGAQAVRKKPDGAVGLGAGRGTTRADHVRPPDASRAPPRRSRTWGSSCSALQRPSEARGRPTREGLSRDGHGPLADGRIRHGRVSGVPVEQAGDRAVLEDLADRAGDQRRDREHGELVELALRRDRQRVGDDDLAGPEFFSRSTAGPERTPCVAAMITSGGAVLRTGPRRPA